MFQSRRSPLTQSTCYSHCLCRDGGYVSNLPVEVAIKIAPQANVVIASDAENKTNSLASIPEYGALYGWLCVYACVLASVRGV